ncbi:MAG: murein biosynthesis integral membrane protein MurJ [Blastochloris sp.]|nr:murein biosynthesis integral membrane protein MurJ [Blastochloris sp.]
MPSTAQSASKITAAVFGSRVLGLVREMIMVSIFGATKEMDAFIAAFRIPNLLRDLFAEGALSTAFVTVFSKKLTKEGREEAFRLAHLVLTALFCIMLVIVSLGMIFNDTLVHLTNPGFFAVEGKGELTISLTRIFFPFILLVSLAAVYMGLLNSLGSFGLPASASSAFNLVSILTGLGLAWAIDPSLGPASIYGFALGTVIGGAAQLLIQLPRAVQLGYSFRWNFQPRDPGLREVIVLMTPAIIGSAAVQINVLVNGYFASFLGDGAVTYLNQAFRLVQLPIGLFGVAIATVTLPSVSRLAALDDFSAFRAKIQEGLQLVFFFCLPAAVGCLVLSHLLIRVLYQRGSFTSEDTLQTAAVLQTFCLGLVGYAGIKLLAPPSPPSTSPASPFASASWASSSTSCSISSSSASSTSASPPFPCPPPSSPSSTSPNSPSPSAPASPGLATTPSCPTSSKPVPPPPSWAVSWPSSSGSALNRKTSESPSASSPCSSPSAPSPISDSATSSASPPSNPSSPPSKTASPRDIKHHDRRF